MPDLLTVDDLADGAAALQVDEHGMPLDVVGLVDLGGSASPAAMARAAALLAGTSRLLIGLGDSAAELAPSLAFCLVRRESGPYTVAVDDPLQHAEGLVTAAARTPQAAAILGPLLRLTGALPVADALVAESLAYSMLLAGAEFAAWRAGTAKRPPSEAAEAVHVSRVGDVLHVALNRPARHNAYAAAVRDGLVEALSIAVLDPSLQVVLRGNGPSFCSGGDLDEFGTTADVTLAHHVRLARSVGLLLHQLRERTTVEVHGACIGAGVELPSFAGQVVAAPGTRFRLPELAMGLVPGAGGTVSVPARIGGSRTTWMVLSGGEVDADTALRWGLVDRVA